MSVLFTRDAGRCSECGCRLRWVEQLGKEGISWWAFYHGEEYVGTGRFDGLLEGDAYQRLERQWPIDWHARSPREDGA